MKTLVSFLVVTCEDMIIFLDAVYDRNTEVQIILEKDDLDTETIEFLKSQSYIREIHDVNTGYFYESDVVSCESLLGNYANMKISIENRIVDFIL